MQTYHWMHFKFTWLYLYDLSIDNTTVLTFQLLQYKLTNIITHLPVIIMQTVNTRKQPENNPTRNVVHGFCWNRNEAFLHIYYFNWFFSIIFILFLTKKIQLSLIHIPTWKQKFFLCDINVLMFPSISYMY